MAAVKYASSRIHVVLAFLALIVWKMLSILSDPEPGLFIGRYTRLLSSEFGRTYIVPAILAICAYFAVRACMLLASGNIAVRMDQTGLRVQSLKWTRNIAWHEVGKVDIIIKRVNWLIRYRCLEICGHNGSVVGKTTHVPIWMLANPDIEIRRFVEDVNARKRADNPAMGLGNADPDGGIDPDAAIARYLARKAQAPAVPLGKAVPAAAMPPAPAPQMRGFGRKGLKS